LENALGSDIELLTTKLAVSDETGRDLLVAGHGFMVH
jgi:hypothetical protein